LTTTQRMKNISDAFTGSVVKEPGQRKKNRSLYISFLQPIGCLPRSRERWLAIRSSKDPPCVAPFGATRGASFALLSEGWWR